MSDLKASRMIGGNPQKGRSDKDFYPTPPAATIALMDFIGLEKGTKVWEPAAGQGHMVKVLEHYGMDVTATDIQTGTDFLTAENPGAKWIITNPPFCVAEQFIRHCKELNVSFALLLKSQYWHAQKRFPLFQEFPPSVICPLCFRCDFTGGGDPQMDVMWCIWLKDWHMPTVYHPLRKPETKK